MKDSWIPALLFVLASPSHATQIFSHEIGGVRSEAEVTHDKFVLRDRKVGASVGSEFVCPLGPAVRATTAPGPGGTGKLCLVYSKEKCSYKSGNGATERPNAQRPGTGAFKCVDLATVQHADTLAALINARAQAHGDGGPARLSAGVAEPSPRDSRVPPVGAAVPKSPSAPASATVAPPTAGADRQRKNGEPRTAVPQLHFLAAADARAGEGVPPALNGQLTEPGDRWPGSRFLVEGCWKKGWPA